MMSELEPKYLLDENIHVSNEFAEAVQAICARQIVELGTTDIDLRKEALKRGLTIVTQDQKFILHSMRLNVPIIWKYKGIWYHAKGNFEMLDNPFDKIGIHCRNDQTVILP